ncbi:MAG: Stp1/IreP family PP2C-type Ser/Thr phosphatase [Clostridia bacterium]|nr:Stp1/IreP family PP2C-type Ser/Thr phosphatase [Clostridia bacterium]
MIFSAMTDVGKVREHNEDSYLAKEYGNATLLAVFDGMGGAVAGEEASSTAKAEFEAYFDAFFQTAVLPEPAALQAALASAADRANFAVYTKAIENPAYKGMGTTLVAALCTDDKIYIANVGDSRAYLIDREVALQVTHDHSFVQHLVDLGKLTPEEARTNPNKNIITRAVGVEPSVGVDVSVLLRPQFKRKTLLLCSDGLSGAVEPQEMVKLRAKNKAPDSLVRAMIDAANAAGGNDNITVIAANPA